MKDVQRSCGARLPKSERNTRKKGKKIKEQRSSRQTMKAAKYEKAEKHSRRTHNPVCSPDEQILEKSGYTLFFGRR